jgi:hypothetical protein
MALKTYDPKKVVCIVGGAIISGYADGSFIACERNVDTFARVVGADGETTRVRSNDRSGKITITLQSSSDSNSVMSGFAIADEVSDRGVVPVLIQDTLGTTLVTAARAWVTKMPNIEQSKEMTQRAWVLETDEIAMFAGGNFSN